MLSQTHVCIARCYGRSRLGEGFSIASKMPRSAPRKRTKWGLRKIRLIARSKKRDHSQHYMSLVQLMNPIALPSPTSGTKVFSKVSRSTAPHKVNSNFQAITNSPMATASGRSIRQL